MLDSMKTLKPGQTLVKIGIRTKLLCNRNKSSFSHADYCEIVASPRDMELKDLGPS